MGRTPASCPASSANRFACVLSKREWQVARLVAQGKRNHEIADEMILSVLTVETHLKHIYAKLNLRSRTELVAWILENHVL